MHTTATNSGNADMLIWNWSGEIGLSCGDQIFFRQEGTKQRGKEPGKNEAERPKGANLIQ